MSITEVIKAKEDLKDRAVRYSFSNLRAILKQINSLSAITSLETIENAYWKLKEDFILEENRNAELVVENCTLLNRVRALKERALKERVKK
jgi:hypothetical protein